MRFLVDETVTFAEEPSTPYTVKATSHRHVILTRPATAKDALTFEYEESIEGVVVYTIVDRNVMMRGPDNLVFNTCDYTKQEDIDRRLCELDAGLIEISRRRSIPVELDNA